jgi:hypothetical protein
MTRAGGKSGGTNHMIPKLGEEEMGQRWLRRLFCLDVKRYAALTSPSCS